MKQVCVVTSTRAEYGLLKGVITKLDEYEDIQVNVVATGTHLLDSFGYTVMEIEEDGVKIAAKIPIFSEDNVSPTDALSKAVKAFGAFLKEDPQDLIVILGDRYEMLGFASAAMLENTPIAHLHGGETTEGAIDESVRHAITKLSHLHFTSTEQYRNRVIQLGEDPERVFYVGAPGVENVLNIETMTREETMDEINRFCGTSFSSETPFALVTFHPVTTTPGEEVAQVKELLEALDKFDFMNFIITKANADLGGDTINEALESFASTRDNVTLVASLGMKRYLSAMKYAEMVIGNSSSGIIEAPSFKIPTINIGDRQKGRVQAPTTIDCEPTVEAITIAMSIASTEEFLEGCKQSENPYEKANTAENIARIIHDFVGSGKLSTIKPFYDLQQ